MSTTSLWDRSVRGMSSRKQLSAGRAETEAHLEGPGRRHQRHRRRADGLG